MSPEVAKSAGLAARRVLTKVRSLVPSSSAPEPTVKAVVAEPGRKGRSPANRLTTPQAPVIDPRFVKSFWRTARGVLGADSVPENHEGMAFDPALNKELWTSTRRSVALATFGDLVGKGRSIQQAHVATVRACCRNNHRQSAQAFTMGLQGLPEGLAMRHVGFGLVAHSMDHFVPAWQHFRNVENTVLRDLVPIEAVHCALKDASPEATAAVGEIVADPTVFDGATLVEIAARFLATGHPQAARPLVEEATGRAPSEFDSHHTEMLANVRSYAFPEPAPAPAVPDSISIGVFDYHSLDHGRASRNLGDYVQTLAMLGNLARFRGTRFHGADGLGELVTEVQTRVRSELHVEGGDADVNLVPVSRDFSEGDPLPENTWALAFGWHMHPLFRLRFGLPYHENLNPIFVSFHVNRVRALTDEAIAYLKANGPIGCRDWTTVDLLLSAGVDAFFTGCLTTTVNAVFPDSDQVEKDEQYVVAVIDLPRSVARKSKRPVESATHVDAIYRGIGLVDGTRGAIDLLANYQRRYSRIITSRLHSYLPATSIGVPVSFRPNIPGDVRFEGLYGMKPGLPAFEDMRNGIRHLINEVFALVLDGADKDTVYAHWRELTAPLVEQAKARLEAPARELPLGFDVAEVVARVNGSRQTYGPHDTIDESVVTDISLSSDHNFRSYLPVTLESIVTNASGPLRVWITGRGLDQDYQRWLSQAFPDLPIVFLPFDGIDYGVIGRMIKHITISTMDRLLLPEVLAELNRITYIDIDTVTEGDVCELARTDLEGFPLAARTSTYSGALLWRSAGDLLSPEGAAELRRTMSARHAFDFVTFNAGVLVLDLERMRNDSFISHFVPMGAEYGLNDQDILNAYVGANRAELAPRWNALPVLEAVTDPGVLHFAGAAKPWSEDLTPYADQWKRYAARFAERVELPMPQ